MKGKSLSVLNIEGKKKDVIELDSVVFDGKINDTLMHQAVVIYLSNQRKGLASVKTRGQVSGGGRKPWRQKGTGRARVGSTRNPLWRGGGVAFGPVPHSFYKDFPKRMKGLSLKSALNAKLRDNEMIVLDSLKLDSPKTKEFFQIIKNLKLSGDRVKFVITKIDNNLKLSSRNIDKTKIVEARNLTTYEALDCRQLVFTKEGLIEVTERIKKWAK